LKLEVEPYLTLSLSYFKHLAYLHVNAVVYGLAGVGNVVNFIISDVFLVVDYFNRGHMYWAMSTFLLIVLPATVVQMFSMRWHIADENANCWHWLAHIFLLGIIHR
jgi:hypothetical protein